MTDMKKVLLALLCIIGLAFAACTPRNNVENLDVNKLDNTVEKCWEITTTVGGYSESYHEWGTEYEIGLALKTAQEIMGNLAKYSYKPSNAADEESCYALDGDEYEYDY